MDKERREGEGDPLKGFALLRRIEREPELPKRLKGAIAFDVRWRALKQLSDVIGLVELEAQGKGREVRMLRLARSVLAPWSTLYGDDEDDAVETGRECGSCQRDMGLAPALKLSPLWVHCGPVSPDDYDLCSDCVRRGERVEVCWQHASAGSGPHDFASDGVCLDCGYSDDHEIEEDPSQEQMEVLRLVLFRHTMKMRQFAILDLERAINELHGPPKVAMGPPDRFAP